MNAILVLVVAASLNGTPVTKAQAAVKRQEEIDIATTRHRLEMPEMDKLIGRGSKLVGYDLRPEFMQYPGDPRPRQVIHLKFAQGGKRYDYVFAADKVCLPKPRPYEPAYTVKVIRPYETIDNVPGSNGIPVKAEDLPAKSKP